MLAASSQLLLWASDPKRKGAQLVGWVSPRVVSAVGFLCLLKLVGCFNRYLVELDNRTIMLDLG